MWSRAYRAERRRCRQALDSLDPAALDDLGSLRRQVERRLGRPVRVVPVEQGALPCGMWVVAADADYVFHAAGTSALHQRHIVVHEFAHMLLGHDPAELTGQAAGALADRVSPATALRMLRRAEYDTSAEREAELLATMILRAPVRNVTRVAEADEAVRRLSAGLGDEDVGDR